MKLKKGDQIIVTIGKDKGKKGKVEKVFPGLSKVLVAGVNTYKRHRKKRDDRHPAGITDLVTPINVAKVALICPKCGKPTRVGYRIVKGVKDRICRKCEQII
jgi:large subunit ribosomal protein L24